LLTAIRALSTARSRRTARKGRSLQPEAYRSADGYLVVVGTGGNDAWGTLCGTLGLDRLVDDARFATNADRVQNVEELQHWLELLGTAGVACAPVQRLHEVLESEQVRVLEMIRTLAHPTAGAVPTVRLPVTLSAAETSAHLPPPLLGAEVEQGFGWKG
jgi:succinate--hydroxymethylglutarate CoA-transferase